jgi:hypothetical protein
VEVYAQLPNFAPSPGCDIFFHSFKTGPAVGYELLTDDVKDSPWPHLFQILSFKKVLVTMLGKKVNEILSQQTGGCSAIPVT